MRRHVGILIFTMGLAVITVGANPLQAQSAKKEKPAEKRSIAYYQRLITDLAATIRDSYMSEVELDNLFNSATDGMLADLDPYSVLLSPQDYAALKESSSGRYEGLGLDVDVRGGEVTIIAPLEGTPAARMGFRPGDRIVRIDDLPIAGMATRDVNSLLRGAAGTRVKLTIDRQGVAVPLDYIIERAVIEVHPVSYHGLVEPKIGYVRIAKFAEKTDAELAIALKSLKKQGAESLVLDLRSNGGGLLDQAVATVNMFLPKNRLVVYTQGRNAATMRRYETTLDPLIPQAELVVLVDSGTASASEIVAGAIQDWDRGVIMGHPTYGKGLVQNVFELGEGDRALKLTTSRYFIPSGRSLQKPERMHKSQSKDGQLADQFAKTSAKMYKTNGGREVFGGGGVAPDIPIAEEARQPIEYNLSRENLFFQFAVKYGAENPEIRLDFAVSDKVIEDFRVFIKSRGFVYRTNLDNLVAELESTADEERKAAGLAKDINSLKNALGREKAKDFDTAREFIRRALRREILSSKFGTNALYEQVVLKEDPAVRAAVELLKDAGRYRSLLKKR